MRSWCYSRPLARGYIRRRYALRQGCICAEADDLDDQGRANYERCCSSIWLDLASRQPAALRAGFQTCLRDCSQTVISAKCIRFMLVWASFLLRYNCPNSPFPMGFDYDRWLGPTPWYPYNEMRVKGDYGGGWRRYWTTVPARTATGAPNHFDIIQWALGMDDSGPVEFIPKGYEKNPFQTHIYADGTKVLRDHPIRNGQMIQFIGDKGEVLVSRGDRLETTPAKLKDQLPSQKDMRYMSLAITRITGFSA